MRPKIDPLKNNLNEAFFEQMRAQEQAFCRNPYIARYRQQIHALIGAEVEANLKAEKTSHGKTTERVTAVLDPVTQTMKTELQTIER